MATETTNYKLIKDGPNEYYDIEKLNANLDKIDEAIYSKVEKIAGKGLSANDYTNAEKAEVAKVKNKAEKSVVDAHLAEKASQEEFGHVKGDEETIFAVNGVLTTTNPYVDDSSGSPGSPNLIAGDMQAGFFGEVQAFDIFTASEIANVCGISEGVPQFENEPWLKFSIDRRIIFRPRKAIRHSISWDAINNANCVYGGFDGKIITKNGLFYRVRLMKGALTDPSKDQAPDKGAKGSEWNRLMLPIHEQVIDKSWAYPAYVEDNVPVWNHNYGTGNQGMYMDEDLALASTNGRNVWCQEIRDDNSGYYVYRGGGTVSLLNSNNPDNTYSDGGWAPVLELIEDGD